VSMHVHVFVDVCVCICVHVCVSACASECVIRLFYGKQENAGNLIKK